ncbi:MAG: ribosome maturation factor RimP [Rickettsiaceae bacterium]
MEHKIIALVKPTINQLGYGLVQVIIRGSTTKAVEILIEKADGTPVQLQDCRNVSKNISAILDVEEVISGKYFLEVSSAGVERPLTNIIDFTKFADKEIKIRLKEPLNGNLSFRGKLLGVHDNKIKLQSKNIVLFFDYDSIKSAKLVFTEEMFRNSLNQR